MAAVVLGPQSLWAADAPTLSLDRAVVSWGLLADQGFKVIMPVKIFWWLIAFPGLALGMTLFVVTLGLNIVALYIVRTYREQYE